MHKQLSDEFQELLSLMWLHIQDEKKSFYKCDEGVYSRFLAYSQRASTVREPNYKTKQPIFTETNEEESIKAKVQQKPNIDDTMSLPLSKNTQEKPSNSHKDPSISLNASLNKHESDNQSYPGKDIHIADSPESDQETLHGESFQKKQFEKLLPRTIQNNSIDISHIRKDVESLQGMPSLATSSLYPENSHHQKTGKWAFIVNCTPGKEPFIQSVVKAINEKLKISTSSFSYSEPLFLSKLPMYVDEYDFLFFVVDSHIEERFTHEIQSHIEPYRGTKTVPPFIIVGRLKTKPLYALILSPNSHEDISFKKSLWERLKLFHTQYLL